MEQIQEEKLKQMLACAVLKFEKYVKDEIMRELPQSLDLWRFYEIGFWFSVRSANGFWRETQGKRETLLKKWQCYGGGILE